MQQLGSGTTVCGEATSSDCGGISGRLVHLKDATVPEPASGTDDLGQAAFCEHGDCARGTRLSCICSGPLFLSLLGPLRLMRASFLEHKSHHLCLPHSDPFKKSANPEIHPGVPGARAAGAGLPKLAIPRYTCSSRPPCLRFAVSSAWGASVVTAGETSSELVVFFLFLN